MQINSNCWQAVAIGLSAVKLNVFLQGTVHQRERNFDKGLNSYTSFPTSYFKLDLTSV